MNTRFLWLLFFFVLGMSLIGGSAAAAIAAIARGEQDLTATMLVWFVGALIALLSFARLLWITHNREIRIQNYQNDLAAKIKK